MTDQLKSGLETRTCSRCGVTAEQVPIGRLISEPMGWTNLTISGLPVTNMRLCPPCTRDVRLLVSVSPANLERARDADLQAAFTRGYDDGVADTRRSPTCRVCGCTEDDCSGCVERTGHACSWVEPDLCSACVPLRVPS